MKTIRITPRQLRARDRLELKAPRLRAPMKRGRKPGTQTQPTAWRQN